MHPRQSDGEYSRKTYGILLMSQRPIFHLGTTMKLMADVSCQQGQIQEKNLDVSAKLNTICNSSIFTETLK